MKQIKDKIHWNSNKVDSYNKLYNICISARGTAKTTMLCTKMHKDFVHRHNHWLIIKRRPVDITEGYIRSIAISINKFLPRHRKITLWYDKTEIKAGQADIYLDKAKTKLFFRIQALSLPSERAKSNMIPDVSVIWFDEQIPNKTKQYLPDEVKLLRDIYGTYSREFTKYSNKTTKIWLTGNPYTLYNPFFSFLNIDLGKIKPGAFLVGKNYCLDFPIISEELKAFILKSNPDLNDDDEYVQYALNGVSLHDTKYKVHKKKPFGYNLKFVFRISDYYLQCWKDRAGIMSIKDKWWIEAVKITKTSKRIYSIDFDNLIQGTCMLTPEIRYIMSGLKQAVGNRQVSYNDVTAAVLIESLYKVI